MTSSIPAALSVNPRADSGALLLKKKIPWRPDRAAPWFVLPAWALILLTLFIPIAVVLLMSFTNYRLGDTEFAWVGLENYAELFQSAMFRNALLRSLLYVLLVVPAAVVFGLMLALLISQIKLGKNFYKAVFFLPVTSTLVAMAIVWKYLLHDTIGPVNQFLSLFGIERIAFFSDPAWVLPSLALIGIWQLAGFNMVLFLAGLTSISQEVNDAATLDGADSFFRRLFTVTLPLISPTMLFVVVTSSITAFKLFDAVAVLTRGGPQGASDVILYAMYREGFSDFNTASAAAMTVVFLVILVAGSWLQARISEKKVHYQ